MNQRNLVHECVDAFSRASFEVKDVPFDKVLDLAGKVNRQLDAWRENGFRSPLEMILKGLGGYGCTPPPRDSGDGEV